VGSGGSGFGLRLRSIDSSSSMRGNGLRIHTPFGECDRSNLNMHC
jgi:hypothetical protein